nr:putative disease resistance protein RGA3 [Ipomoea batatas]
MMQRRKALRKRTSSSGSKISKTSPTKWTMFWTSKVETLPDTICSLENLRTLVLQNCDQLSRLPDKIGDLNQLRYINLSESKVKKLPETICSLENLQTLVLKGCMFLSTLPEGIGNLVELRYIDLNGCGNVEQQPQYQAQLVEQTPIEQQGSVHEQPHGHYTPSTDLVEQQQVQRSEPISTSQHDTTDQEVTSDQPKAEAGGVAFPKLKKLEFYDCPEWEEWEDFKEEATIIIIMPCIRELALEHCWKLKTVPHHLLSRLEDLKIEDCPSLKVELIE